MANVSLRSTSNLLSVLPKRYASTATATAQAKEQRRPLPKESIKVTKLDNGIVVASLENHSPVTRVAAVLNVGPRDETNSELGAVHALRAFSSLATRNFSKFGVSRNLDQIGAQLSVTSSREKTTYLLESVRRSAAKGVDILAEIISRPELRHWEIHDDLPRLEFDLDVYDETPELRLSDLIHSAAFRKGLSNPLYAPRFNVHNLDSSVLEGFRNKNFNSGRLTLVGLGIGHDDLIRQADLFRLNSASGPSRQPAKYLGSEARENNLSDLVHVAIASEGVSLSSKDLLASQIASHAFGTNVSRIKYSAGSSKLAKALLPLANEPAAVSSFTANYSDAGLFGFHIIGNKNDIGKLAKGLIKEVASASKNGLSNEELNRAKNSLKASLSEQLDNSHNLIAAIAQNPESSQTNINELHKAVDSVSANDVNAFIKRVATSKPSLAAVGDLSELPRLDELSA